MKRVFAHIGFSFALTLIILNFIGIKWALAAFVAAGALFVISLLFGKTRRAASVPLCLFSVLLAAFIFNANYYLNYAPQAQLAGKSAKVSFYIIDAEQKTSYGFSYTVKTDAIEMKDAPQNIKLKLYTYTPLDFDYYEQLQGELKLDLISSDAYDSYGYYADGVFLRANPVDNLILTGKEINSPLKLMLDFRLHIRGVFKTYICGDAGALALAILTGNKSDINTSVYDSFKASGLAHLVAVSGFHLMVLCGTVYYLLRRLSVSVIPRAVLSALFVLFYILLSGFAPSMMRAGLMMLVFLIGKTLRQKSDSLNSLGIAAFLVCFFNPYAVTDAGTMLSYTAVLGILTINQPLRNIFKADRIKNKLFAFAADGIILSCAIFISTFPVMLFFFRQASLIGIIISFFTIPLAQVLLISSFLFIALYKVNFISAVLVFVIRLFAGIIIDIAARAAGLAFSLIYLDYFYFALAVAAVFALFGVGFILRSKKAIRLCALLSVAAFCIICVCGAVSSVGKTFVRALAGYNSTAYLIYDESYAMVLGVKDNSQMSAVKQIVKANGLTLMLVLDTDCSGSAQTLAQDCFAVNYVCPDEKAKSLKIKNCKNILCLSEFDIDLWQGVNVKYINDAVDVSINGSEFCFDYVSFSQCVEYDYVISVSQSGRHYRRLNRWQD